MKLLGAWIVDPDVFRDERGVFARTWVPDEFTARGLDPTIAQCSYAASHRRGTIRGLHYQSAPFEEVKVVRVVRGAIFDVAVDLRPESPTFCQWVGVELTAENLRSVYLPRGLAHGYQTLTDHTEVYYFVSTPYTPTHQQGVRWDDPAFGIEWPLGAPSMINDRDRTFRDFGSAVATGR